MISLPPLVSQARAPLPDEELSSRGVNFQLDGGTVDESCDVPRVIGTSSIFSAALSPRGWSFTLARARIVSHSISIVYRCLSYCIIFSDLIAPSCSRESAIFSLCKNSQSQRRDFANEFPRHQMHGPAQTGPGETYSFFAGRSDTRAR